LEHKGKLPKDRGYLDNTQGNGHRFAARQREGKGERASYPASWGVRSDNASEDLPAAQKSSKKLRKTVKSLNKIVP
jgi:hypothetical protein